MLKGRLTILRVTRFLGQAAHRWHDESAAHGMRRYQHDLDAHSDIVPAALVVLKPNVPEAPWEKSCHLVQRTSAARARGLEFLTCHGVLRGVA